MSSVPPSGKHDVHDLSSTITVLQSQPLACPSVLPVPSNKLSVYLHTVRNDVIAGTEFPAFASLCATFVLISVELVLTSKHV